MSPHGSAMAKPGPVRSPTDEPFWAAAHRGELVVQRCARCGATQHYPRVLCVRCWAGDPEWIPVRGTGRVWTYTVVHRPAHPAWLDDVPYAIALVELDEGPRLMTTLAGVAPTDVRVGLAVEAVFVERDAATTLVHFTPARSPRSDSGAGWSS